MCTNFFETCTENELGRLLARDSGVTRSVYENYSSKLENKRACHVHSLLNLNTAAVPCERVALRQTESD